MAIDPEWVGSAAAFCTTVAFLPQTIKIIRERDTRSISLGMYLIFSVGVTFWFAYGLLIGSVPIWFSNIFVMVMSYTILLMKIKLG